MTLLLVYLFIAIGFSFYCSVAEAVLLSVAPSFIASMRERRPAVA
ncbi:MAG: hemolysin, partial [Planctomycetota bacterium]